MQLITVIMPYYKKIDYVRHAINSVLNQTYQNYELLIIYDDIDQRDLDKLRNIINDNKKIKIIKNYKNLGAGYSRNIGIKNSNGTIISFIDADDEWHPKKIENQLNFLNKHNCIRFWHKNKYFHESGFVPYNWMLDEVLK